MNFALILASLVVAPVVHAAWIESAQRSAPSGLYLRNVRGAPNNIPASRYFVFPKNEINWKALQSGTRLSDIDFNKISKAVSSAKTPAMRLVFMEEPELTHSAFVGQPSDAKFFHLEEGELPLVLSSKARGSVLSHEIQHVNDLQSGVVENLRQDLSGIRNESLRYSMAQLILEARGYNAAYMDLASNRTQVTRLFKKFWLNYGFFANRQISAQKNKTQEKIYEVFEKYTLKEFNNPFYRAILKSLKDYPQKYPDQIKCRDLLV